MSHSPSLSHEAELVSALAIVEYIVYADKLVRSECQYYRAV